MTVGTHPRAQRAHARTDATGAASTALRRLLESPRRPARVLAAFPYGIYLEVRTELEPQVIAVVTGSAVRLPNAMVVTDPMPRVAVGDEAYVGDGSIEVGRLSLRAHRWWNPAPPLGPVDPARLAAALPRLAALCDRSARRPGLEGNGAADLLAEGCAEASLLRGVTAAEQLVGLGPGLTPSGDDMLAGVLVALRHLGTAAGIGRAVWLADWLAAAVTFDARGRTTPISAALLHCAARGEAGGEVLAVLRGLAGRQDLEPALHRLLQLGHTSGADLAWGLRIGLAAVVSLEGRSE
ncbi:DUF2877 domain-containing protein [Streptosporangium minutum]|uniref:DUF2877 domain-containing protein n=1 Tax=Streptosporangium minutum TaxID=569862 RepID=A0A243R1I5_9ACTN|nr:DUF2877 domain-containing protein [Streptosporangium minutum]OUC88219.1 hypothetical protein CA984_37785 [Streptosporangium minutum]